jgi:hypothetical protein
MSHGIPDTVAFPQVFVHFIFLSHFSGRVPGWAAYTKVDWKDRTKLSSLHRSGNRKLLQVESRIGDYTFVAQKWERRVNSNEGNYIYWGKDRPCK